MAKLILLLGLVCVGISQITAKCTDYTDCGSCAGKSDFFVHCEWCASSKSCYLSLEGNDKCPNEDDRVKIAFECPIDPPPGDDYSDDYARNKILPYIGASNALNMDQIQTCLDNHFDGVKAYKQYYQICDEKNSSCAAFIAVSPDDKAIVLTYEGSKGWNQLVNEGVDFLFDKMVELDIGGKVDKYYYDGFYTLWNVGGIKDDVALLAAQYPDYEFWVNGHSMGGALASITSAIVISDGTFAPEKVKLITFGQPRTGDETYAEIHDNLVPYRFRIVHNKDKVPHLPWQVTANSAYHHRFEVWYPNDMTEGSPYTVCHHAEDKTCSDSVQHTTTDDHLYYFNYHIPDWYEGGCQK